MSIRATYPEPGYSRPPAISPSGLTVTVYGESGELFGEMDFSGIKAPSGLVDDLVKAFAKATNSDGRWRSRSTVREAASLVRRFAEDIASDNPAVTSLRDYTAEMWWQWRTKITERTRWPGQINMARCLLYEAESLPNTTRNALAARTKKPKNRLYQAYSIAEYRRIYAAAWKVVRQARRRIGANLDVLQQYRNGKEPSDAPALPIRKVLWTRGQLLDHFMKFGHFPGGHVPHYLISVFRDLLGVNDNGSITQAVFATTTEVFSALVLLGCERGFNLSVMNGLTADPMVADVGEKGPAVTVHPLDKPRRGANARYFSASLSGKAARIWKAVHEITQPARDHLANNGKATDALLLGRVLEGVSSEGLFKSDWTQCHSVAQTWLKKTNLLADDGSPLFIDFRRLRLTDQVINQRSNQNSERVSESVYRMPDPQTQEMARDAILQGQMDALSDAKALVAIRGIKQEELKLANLDPSALANKLGISIARLKQLMKGALDTATVACIDFKSSPFASKGSACVASFLKCFSCKNAIATPHHLPRLVILLDALDEISSAVNEAVWCSDYMEVRAQLSSLLAQYATEQELRAARVLAKPEDIEAVKALLERRLDA